MSALSLRDVSKSYGGVHAVQNLSLSILPGRITGLIGPNGAGKSTVVNLITGMTPPNAGHLLIRDIDITGRDPHRIARLGVARTFQNIRLFADASVLDNVLVGFHRHEQTGLLSGLFALPRARREYAATTARAHALLERFGMTRYAELPAGGLSYGHQRRVEMMRALATDPEFLLLDEPIAGMNNVEAGELGAIYRDLAASGIGILLIEHNVGFVAAHCETVHVVNLGRLIASGSPRDVLSDKTVIEAYLGS